MIVDGFDISKNGIIYLIAEMSANHNGNIENAFKTAEWLGTTKGSEVTRAIVTP